MIQGFDPYHLPLNPDFHEREDCHMLTIPQAQMKNDLDKTSTYFMPSFAQI